MRILHIKENNELLVFADKDKKMCVSLYDGDVILLQQLDIENARSNLVSSEKIREKLEQNQIEEVKDQGVFVQID